MMLVDPLPAIDIALSPSEKSGSNVNPFMRNSAPPPKEKGDIQGMLREVGVNWSMSQIVWDQYNPHPDLSHLPSEVVFVGAGNENPNRFNQDAINTAALQELILLFSGYLQPLGSAEYTFTPLVQSGQISGEVPYSQMVQRNFFGGAQLVMRKTLRRPSASLYTMAAHIEGKNAGRDSTASEKVNLIVVADVDFVSQQFFDIRRLGVGGFNFDNVTFFLNSMDVLMADESFINLRSKRVKYRTLETVEAQTLAYTQQRVQDEEQAEREAQQALEEARTRLTARVNEVRQRTDLDDQTKQIMVRNLEEVENRRFETLKTNIETEKEAKIQASKENMEQQIRLIQNTIKNLAALMPPIPVFVLGVFIFIRRRQREKDAAVAARRLRN
jgi:ABC-2 type transport system permease protein